MKKPVFYLLTILLALSACANEKDEIIDPPDEVEDNEIIDPPDEVEDNEIIDSEILEAYFEEWDITIPYYQDVSKSETYRLLNNLVGSDYIRKKVTPYGGENEHYILTPTAFNNFMLNNEDATVLAKRNNCIDVLISTYLPLLTTNVADIGYEATDIFYIELVLSCDMFMSKMHVKEKVQLMVLALERIKYEYISAAHFNLIISIMLSSNYTPFIENVYIIFFFGKNNRQAPWQYNRSGRFCRI